MTSLKKTMIAVSCLVLSVVPVTAQTKTDNARAVRVVATSATVMSDMRPTPVPVRPVAAAVKDAVTRVMVVSLADRRLALVEDGVVRKVYRVAVGREDSPSPTGTFTVVDRVENPTYYHPGAVIPPGPGNPVGTRWIGLDKKGYGIHGTNVPRSIGKAASHGCIRMRRHDLEELFAQVRSGDEVEIIGARNAETAAIFGGPVTGVEAAGQTVTAAVSDTAEPSPAPASVVAPAGR